MTTLFDLTSMPALEMRPARSLGMKWAEAQNSRMPATARAGSTILQRADQPAVALGGAIGFLAATPRRVVADAVPYRRVLGVVGHRFRLAALRHIVGR